MINLYKAQKEYDDIQVLLNKNKTLNKKYDDRLRNEIDDLKNIKKFFLNYNKEYSNNINKINILKKSILDEKSKLISFSSFDKETFLCTISSLVNLVERREYELDVIQYFNEEQLESSSLMILKDDKFKANSINRKELFDLYYEKKIIPLYQFDEIDFLMVYLLDVKLDNDQIKYDYNLMFEPIIYSYIYEVLDYIIEFQLNNNKYLSIEEIENILYNKVPKIIRERRKVKIKNVKKIYKRKRK